MAKANHDWGIVFPRQDIMQWLLESMGLGNGYHDDPEDPE